MPQLNNISDHGHLIIIKKTKHDIALISFSLILLLNSNETYYYV